MTTSCLCCSNLMLQEVRNQRLVWFCRHCWQEMPVQLDVQIEVRAERQREKVKPPHAVR